VCYRFPTLYKEGKKNREQGREDTKTYTEGRDRNTAG
jgi:hypothetical protein